MNEKQDEIKIKSIKRETMSKQVVDQIIELLMSGQLKPGDKLPTEAELSDRLFVSRPVLREALSSLETMGMIHRKTREGTYFSNRIGSKPFSIMLALSAGDIPSIVEARMALELGLVTMAAEKITAEQLHLLEQNLQQMSLNKTEYSEIDKAFHRTIAYSANNPILEGSIDPLLNMFDETLSQIPLDERDHTATMQQHQAIFEALKRRDPIAAYSSMYLHLGHVRAKVMKAIQEG
ncbi:FadR/GntR family transcriptional regulator [Paenibacillus cremeus]|uniref:FadR family transcriptional regulator n=1 Tax=Paenibacillus cremeus TaxID=2163881 RepID=A0A559JK45_9BACL|nr:FadR/GntR family transcriptional regulator [Paenibacillus cremeus]TVY00253.1 FadR family transcriptional regulator [Paenibacillus cremeus]